MRSSTWCRRTGPWATRKTCRRPAATSGGSTRPPRESGQPVPLNRGRQPEGMSGLLGGSYDPVHQGHLIVAQVAAEALGLECLGFVPAREQAFKHGRHSALDTDRAAMLAL